MRFSERWVRRIADLGNVRGRLRRLVCRRIGRSPFEVPLGIGFRAKSMPPGRHSVHSVAPRNIAAAIGVQYFKQVFITWSIRSRGSVQRTHIMNVTPTTHLNTKFKFPGSCPDRLTTGLVLSGVRPQPMRRSAPARSSRRKTESPPAR